jgi:hypothetical protein
MDPAAAAEAVRNALQQHERNKRSTDIPLYYGKKDKDTISPQFLVDRITHAGTIAGWNDQRKAEELYMTLRDRALLWYESLASVPGIDRADWATIRREFIDAFAPKYSAKTNCSNFAEMVQRSHESVQDYYLRIWDIFRNMCKSKPAAITVVRTGAGDPRAAVKLEGIEDMESFFLHQLFMAGLKEDIRAKIMEANRAQLHESLALAREIEVIQTDRKGKGVTVAPIQEKDHDEGDEKVVPEGLDEEEIELINAIRFKKGKKPFFKRNAGQGSYQNKTPFKCFYCKKANHYQRDCKTRIRDKAPMVNSKGEPYQTQHPKVHNISREQDREREDVGVDLYKMSTIGKQSLNF